MCGGHVTVMWHVCLPMWFTRVELMKHRRNKEKQLGDGQTTCLICGVDFSNHQYRRKPVSIHFCDKCSSVSETLMSSSYTVRVRCTDVYKWSTLYRCVCMVFAVHMCMHGLLVCNKSDIQTWNWLSPWVVLLLNCFNTQVLMCVQVVAQWREWPPVWVELQLDLKGGRGYSVFLYTCDT